MVIYGILWDFYGIFYGDFMKFNAVLMGTYGDFMVIESDLMEQKSGDFRVISWNLATCFM